MALAAAEMQQNAALRGQTTVTAVGRRSLVLQFCGGSFSRDLALPCLRRSRLLHCPLPREEVEGGEGEGAGAGEGTVDAECSTAGKGALVYGAGGQLEEDEEASTSSNLLSAFAARFRVRVCRLLVRLLLWCHEFGGVWVFWCRSSHPLCVATGFCSTVPIARWIVLFSLSSW